MQDFNPLTSFIHFILYILFAIGLYRLAKRQKLGAPWMGWIPILNLFLFLQLVENDVHHFMKGKLQLSLLFIFIYNFIVFGTLSLTIMIIGLTTYLTLTLYAFFFLARRYSKNYMIHFIAAILTLTNTMFLSVFLFRFQHDLKVFSDNQITEKEMTPYS